MSKAATLGEKSVKVGMSVADYQKLIDVAEHDGDSLCSAIRKMIRRRHRRITAPPDQNTISMRFPKNAVG